MEDNEIKVRKILGKSQPNFQHYITKIEVLANHWFKKRCISYFTLREFSKSRFIYLYLSTVLYSPMKIISKQR